MPFQRTMEASRIEGKRGAMSNVTGSSPGFALTLGHISIQSVGGNDAGGSPSPGINSRATATKAALRAPRVSGNQSTRRRSAAPYARRRAPEGAFVPVAREFIPGRSPMFPSPSSLSLVGEAGM